MSQEILCYIVVSMYMHQCPAETFVPIYLVDLGVFYVIMCPILYKSNKTMPAGGLNLSDWGLLSMALMFLGETWLTGGEFTPNSYYW